MLYSSVVTTYLRQVNQVDKNASGIRKIPDALPHQNIQPASGKPSYKTIA